MQQRWKPSLVVVGGLLVLAVVMVIVLWAAAQTQGDGGGTDTTAAPSDAVTVKEMTVFDPDGDGGETEDNSPKINQNGALIQPWQTYCYKTADISDKNEIGLMVKLSAPSKGTLSALIDTGPWTAAVYAVDSAAPLPDEGLAPWGAPLMTKSGAAKERWDVPVDSTKLNLLLVFTQIGEGGDSCTNPSFTFRARITQLTFTAA